MPIQVTTRERVIYLRRKNPRMTLEAIGDKCGVSRQRIHSILKNASETTVAVKPKCVCPNCDKPIRLNRKFCSRKCKYEHNYPLVSCMTCGKLFRRYKRFLYLSSHNYCSNSCKGQANKGKKYSNDKKIRYANRILLSNGFVDINEAQKNRERIAVLQQAERNKVKG